MKPIAISARLVTMYGHAARKERGSAVAKNGPIAPMRHGRAAVQQRMRSRAECVEVFRDRRVRVVAARDREVARSLAEQQAEALDVTRGLVAKAPALGGLDRRFERGPAPCRSAMKASRLIGCR